MILSSQPQLQIRPTFLHGGGEFRVGGRECVSGKTFDRGQTCCMPSPGIYLNGMQQRVYNLGHQVLGTSVKYTLVDFLLNEGLWDKARNILDFWTLSMSHLPRFDPLSA